MKYTNTFPLIFFYFIATVSLYSQTSYGRHFFGEKYAKQELKKAQSKEIGLNYIDQKRIIVKDSLTAINIAEQILFSIYDRKQIIKQRPYEIHFLDNYWVILGTLPQDYIGGTFRIIFDARDCRVLLVTHGK